MNGSKKQLLRSLAAVMIACAGFAACSQDDLADKPQGAPLPPGEYPIAFTAVQALPEETPDGVPQTRVSDSGNTSSWTDDDRIMVTVSGGGASRQTACTLDADGKIKEYDPQLYWQTTGNYTIDAWYSNIGGQATTTPTVSLADQSSGLAYVLKVKPIIASYQTASMKLEFEHQLAKVQVTVVNDGYTGNLNNLSVVMQECYTSCTVTNGSVGNGGSKGEIKMRNVGNKTFEANVVEGTVLKDNAFKISADGKTSVVSLSNGVTLAKGKVHTVTLKVKDRSATEVEIKEGEITRIEGAGNYIIKGSHSIKSIVEIMKNGDYTITLEDTQLNKIELENRATANITYIIKGNVTLDEGILAAGKGKISIKGTEGSMLTINKSDEWSTHPAIGNANGWKTGVELIIEDAYIVAKGAKGAAVIGTNRGDMGLGSVGDITIRNSTLELTAQSYAPDAANGIKPAVIGTGGHPNSDGEGVHCGDIKIYLKEGETKQEFLDRLGGVFHTKVGAGLDKSGRGLTSCGSINWYNSQGDPVD